MSSCEEKWVAALKAMEQQIYALDKRHLFTASGLGEEVDDDHMRVAMEFTFIVDANVELLSDLLPLLYSLRILETHGKNRREIIQEVRDEMDIMVQLADIDSDVKNLYDDKARRKGSLDWMTSLLAGDSATFSRTVSCIGEVDDDDDNDNIDFINTLVKGPGSLLEKAERLFSDVLGKKDHDDDYRDRMYHPLILRWIQNNAVIDCLWYEDVIMEDILTYAYEINEDPNIRSSQVFSGYPIRNHKVHEVFTDPHEPPPCCYRCGDTLASLKCSGCATPFCSREHQVSNWKRLTKQERKEFCCCVHDKK